MHLLGRSWLEALGGLEPGGLARGKLVQRALEPGGFLARGATVGGAAWLRRLAAVEAALDRMIAQRDRTSA